MSTRYHFGLLGHKIAYSQSPDIFAAIAKQTGCKIQFDLFDISPLDLDFFMQRISAQELSGLSVTIPHKESVMRYLTECDQVAQEIEAVNSIKIDGPSLAGYNTDWEGVAQSLLKHAKSIANGKVLILGTGGVARAVVFALCTSMKPKELTIAGRSQEQLEHLKATSSRFSIPCKTVERDLFEPGKGKFHLVVNCTPLGGWHYPNVSPLPKGLDWSHVGIYFDVNYNTDNVFIGMARKLNIPALDGRMMLVAQAVRSFELWTGQKTETDKIYRAVFKTDRGL